MANQEYTPATDEQLRLLCVVAHPDDESLALGGILAKYAAEGVETHLVTATRGERGWFGAAEQHPGLAVLGAMRQQELRAAAEVLGIRGVVLLDYVDGEVAQADQTRLVARIVEHIRRVRPHVVVTFDHNGIYGHPDHIAVTRATTTAMVAAADAAYAVAGAPHAVPKLYYFAWTKEVQVAFERAFGELRMQIDGVERRPVAWPQWAVSARIDTSQYWGCTWEAIRCHRSQLPGYEKLLRLPAEYHRALWGELTFHRVYSLVATDETEDDLFAGLRERGDRHD